MTSAPFIPRLSSTRLYQAGLLLSVSYCIAAGALAVGSERQNGVDISVCYVAGVTATRGSTPYDQRELYTTRQTQTGPLATKPSYPFGYPPSVVPGCILLSRLPWEVSQALWKTLNIAFLVGCVLLTFGLFSSLQFRPNDRYLLWSFAFVCSPTVSVLLVGQSSLFVLFALLSTLALTHLGKPLSAGSGLALALTKPHLAFPLFILLLLRRRYKVVFVASCLFIVLVIGGLLLGHSSIGSYLKAVQEYASSNSAAGNPRLVGIQSLSTRAFGLSDSIGRMLSAICGLCLVAVVLFVDTKCRARDCAEDVLPLMLLVSVLSFGAHSYDLVFLIPVCGWAVGQMRMNRLFLAIVILCFLLIIPLNLVTIAYERLLAGLVPRDIFTIVIEPFRSWIVLAMSGLVLPIIYWKAVQRPPPPRGRGRAPMFHP